MIIIIFFTDIMFYKFHKWLFNDLSDLIIDFSEYGKLLQRALLTMFPSFESYILEDILLSITWLSWLDSRGIIGARIYLLSMCIIQEPAISQTPTLQPISTDMMNIRDHRVYWYIKVCYPYPYPRVCQFLGNGYKFLGHNEYPIPKFTLTFRVSGWTLNLNEIQPRRVRS